MRRAFALVSLLAGGPVLAADVSGPDIPSFAEQVSRQWRIEDTKPPSESAEYLRTRDDTVERLSLREAVAIALAENPRVATERLGPPFARANVRRSFGVFDPELEAFAELRRVVTPSSSALSGASVVRQKDYNYGVSLEKVIRTGATVSASFHSNELDLNSSFIGLRPQYKPELLFSVTQPLLRDFGPGLTVLLVRSAEVGSEAAYCSYRAGVTALVREVIEAYWQIVGAHEALRAVEDGLRLARALEAENGARVRAGVLPPIAVKEAAAEAARREEQVIVARNALDTASDRLRLLLQRNPSDTFLPRPIEPIDSPEVRTVDTDEAATLERAITGRPEVLRARSEIENQRLLARLARNNLLPDLELKGGYGLNALSGTAVPQRDFRTGETRLSPFGGSYGDGVDRLFSDDFNSYSAGVTLTVPLGNAVAEADFAQRRIDLQRTELAYRQLLADVTLEVRTAIGNVRSLSKRITASRLARELAEETLEQQKKRYEVGLATTKDILDFQEKLTVARAAEIHALIGYNLSLAFLRQAEGRLLDEYDVVLERLPPPPTPIWARF